MQVREGLAPFREYQTWYRITGDLGNGGVPLIVVHGGPGCTHDYLDSLRGLAARGHPVIHYDQVGNGRSTHLPDKGADFWTVDLFLDELEHLLRHLGIADEYVLFGHSWGGILSSEHAVRRPPGLKALVLANTLASMELWVAGARSLRAALPMQARAALDQHEAAGTTEDPEYLNAAMEFYIRHVCRIHPWPPEVARTFAAMESNPTVYRTMNGPTEFHVIGTLREWSIIDRLHLVSVPTLVLRGAYDEATLDCVAPFRERIANVDYMEFADSSHMPHVEETDLCLSVVEEFLTRLHASQERY